MLSEPSGKRIGCKKVYTSDLESKNPIDYVSDKPAVISMRLNENSLGDKKDSLCLKGLLPELCNSSICSGCSGDSFRNERAPVIKEENLPQVPFYMISVLPEVRSAVLWSSPLHPVVERFPPRNMRMSRTSKTGEETSASHSILLGNQNTCKQCGWGQPQWEKEDKVFLVPVKRLLLILAILQAEAQEASRLCALSLYSGGLFGQGTFSRQEGRACG